MNLWSVPSGYNVIREVLKYYGNNDFGGGALESNSDTLWCISEKRIAPVYNFLC